MPSIHRAVNVSPTAHYTAAVWARNGLSHPAFATFEGHLLFNAARPALALSKYLGGPTLEGLLLARHRVIDERLRRAIEVGEVTQIIEIAAGLSARGWRFAREYGERVHYIEADLPGMAARKRTLLTKAGGGSSKHQVLDIDAFASEGPQSLAGIAAGLDRNQGLAIITEGLVNYFPTPAVTALWSRIATTLSEFTSGIYWSDLHLAGENSGAGITAFVRLLSAFVRGRVHLHFENLREAERALSAAGFAHATLHRPSDQADIFPECRDPAARLLRIIEARVGR